MGLIDSCFELSVGQLIYLKHHRGRYSDRGWVVQEFVIIEILNDECIRIESTIEPQWVKTTNKHLADLDWFLDKDKCQEAVNKANVYVNPSRVE